MAQAGSLWIKLGLNSKSFNTDLKKAEQQMKAFSKNIGALGATMTNAFTIPLLAIGAAALKSSHDINNAYSTIRTGTGATGTALEQLKKSFNTVFSNVPSSAAEAGQAIADLSTRTGQTGKALEKLAIQELNLARIQKTDIASTVASTTRIFGDWGIATNEQSRALNYLFKASQATGPSVQRIGELIVQYGAPMRQMGFSFEQAAALMGKFEKEGVNTETVMSSFRIGLIKLSQSGENIPETFARVIEAIKNVGSTAEANVMAAEIFGKRAGPDMAAAIREGRFGINDLIKSLNSSRETINKAAEDALTFGDKMKRMANKAEVAFAPVGSALEKAFEKMFPAVEKLLQKIADLAEWFANLSPKMQENIINAGLFVAAAGPMLTIISKLAAGIKGLVEALAWLASGGIIKGIKGIGTALSTTKTSVVLLAKSFSSFLVGGAIIAGFIALAAAISECIKQENILMQKQKISDTSLGQLTDPKKIKEALKVEQEKNKLLAEQVAQSKGIVASYRGADTPYSRDAEKGLAKVEAEKATSDIRLAKLNAMAYPKPKAKTPEVETPKITSTTTLFPETEKSKTPADIIKEYGEALTEIKNKESAMTSLFDEPAAKADLLLSKIQELSAIDPSNKVLKSWITDYKTITDDIETAKKLEEDRLEQEKKITEELEKQNKRREDAISYMQELADAAETAGQPEGLESDKTWNEQIKKLNEKFYVQQATTQEEYNASRANIDKIWAANHEKEATDAWQSELDKYTDAITKQMQLDQDLTKDQKKQIEQRLANRLLELDPNTPEYDATFDIYKNLGTSNLASSDIFGVRWQAGLADGIKSLQSFGDTVQQISSSIASSMSSAFETEFFNIFQGEYSNLKEMFSSLEDIVADFLNSITQNISKMLANMATQQLMSWISSLTGTAASVGSAASVGAGSVIGTSVGSAASIGAGSVISGALAGGGSVSSNNAYLVGEKGPELFVPSSSGSVIANSQLAAMNQGSGGSGGGNVSVNVINSTGTQATAKVTSKKSDSTGNQAITVVMEAVRKNTGGSRDFFRALGNS